MKIVVKGNGSTSLKQAMETIQSFLASHEEEYPQVKGNLSLYLSLEATDGKACPDNGKDFVLETNGDIIDMDVQAQDREKVALVPAWEEFCHAVTADIKLLETNIARANYYLCSAEDRQRKPENIKARTEKLHQDEKTLKRFTAMASNFDAFTRQISKGECTFFVRKFFNKDLNAYEHAGYIIFAPINGKTWTFKRKGNSGALYEGLPKGYQA